MLISLALATLAFQTTPAPDPDCDSPNQFRMNLCAARIAEAAESLMEARYAEVMEAVRADDRLMREEGYTGPSRPEVLERSQAAWLQYREDHCYFEALENFGGSMFPSTAALCDARLAGQRERELAADASITGE